MYISKNIKFLYIVVMLALIPFTAVQSQLKIMPLGDSITQGVDSTAVLNSSLLKYEIDGTLDYKSNVISGALAPGSGGYRLDLEQMLLDMDWDVEMVGQLTEGGGHHEGYPGYMAPDILQILPDILDANPPDVILLHIGSNGLPEPIDADSCYKNIQEILDVIHDFDDNIKVILAQIIPCLQDISYGQQRYPAIIELNNLIPQALVNRSYVSLVDMWTPFVDYENWETALMSGTWHPNAAGYNLMAEIWLDALDLIVDGRTPLAFNSTPTEGYISESNLECTIDGGYFMNGVSIHLQRVSTGQQLSAFQVTYENENRVYATFDLNDGFVGQWKIMAVNPNKMRSINSPDVLFSILTDASVTPYCVRINTGGNTYTDIGADEWLADQEYTLGSFGYVGGNIHSTADPISGTDDDPLYQSERWGMSAYRFDVPDGDYHVELHFAEIYFEQKNSRLMNVDIEEVTVLSGLDIYDEVGHDAALSYLYSDISVNDGRVDIIFSSSVEAPKISAIKVSSIADIPVLAVNPDLLDFGVTETNLTFTVENSGEGTLNWTAVENPDQSWITSVNPASGNLSGGSNQVVTVTVNRAGLSGGVYNGVLSVTSNGGSEDVSVDMTVSDDPPILLVTPTTLDFGIIATVMTFNITNNGGSTLSWNIAENPDESWLLISGDNNGNLSSGQSVTIQVDVNRSGISQGMYYGEILVTSNGGSQPIDIIVEIGDPPTSPELQVAPHVLDFNTGLNLLTFIIKNRGIGSLDWSASENPTEEWITSILPLSGSLSSMEEVEVTVTVDRSSLNNGSYAGLISINSNGGNDNIEVEMIVGDPPNIIRSNVGGSSYTDINSNIWSMDRPYHAGAWGHVRGHPSSVTANINNTQDDELYQTELFWLDGYKFDLPNGNYTVVLHFAEIYYNYAGGRVFNVYIEAQRVLNNFDIYAEAGFLTATTRTFSDIQVADGRLDIDFEHLAAHAKVSAIGVISEDVENPDLSVSSTTLNFGSAQTSLTFTVTNIGNGTLNWLTSENPDQSWITLINPASGSLTAGQSHTVTVAVDRSGLTEGDYSGTISITSNGGSVDVTINMIVTNLSFTDITLSAGTGGPTGSGQTGGHSAVFADVDDDGRPDLYITMLFENPMSDLFFHNNGGNSFTNEGVARGINDFDGGSHGACFADLDNDGDYDLFNGTTYGSSGIMGNNNIYQNDGNGNYADVTESSGIPEREWLTRAALTFDMDTDGDLDLFTVTNWLGSDDPSTERNRVYRND